jgi:hypothetical protein
MAKKSSGKSATPKAAKPARPKAGKSTSGKPGASNSKAAAKKSKPLEMSPITRQLLESARNRSPIDAAGAKTLSKGEVDAIRQFAITLAEKDLSADDEDLVMICNRIAVPPAIPLTDVRYDTCRWCEAEIYYDRLMPSRPEMIRVCVPCGIMLLDAEKKGRN